MSEETIKNGKPVVTESTEKTAEPEMEMSEEGHPLMKQYHVSMLKEINGKKEQTYRHIGMVMEALHQSYKELDSIEEQRSAVAAEIQEQYKLPDNKVWQLNPNSREIIVTDQPTKQ